MPSGSLVVGVAAAAITCLLASAAAVAGQAPARSEPADPGLDTALAAVELMDRVPVGIRETCRPTDPFIEGMDTAVECSVEGGLVFYARFVDAAAVDAAYGSLRASAGTDSDTGVGCAAGAFEAAYGDEDGTPDGRLLCHVTDGAYIGVWTHADDPILAGLLLDSNAGFEALAATWEEARLLESGTTAPSAPVASASTAPADATGGEAMLQWASSAAASSEYGPDSWSASQATGEPDTPDYGDFATAWAPVGSDVGPQWLEVGFDTPVRPMEVVIWETSGAGFVTLVEALDERSGDWVVLWEGSDGSPGFVAGFSPPLESTDVVTDTIRVTIDSDVPGWNEIDAVGLLGVPAEP
jgi:hypothetical protein